jgi:GNAT superfamily N-acetyltransferase
MRAAKYSYQLMSADEAADVCRFVNGVFESSVAPLYTKRGLRNFREYADSEAMSQRARSDHFVLLAVENGRIAGMIEMRDHKHVSLLFVEPDRQGRGLGKQLLQKALEVCRSAEPDIQEITVNSSPNAVSAYERMGFEATGREQTINGVRSTPMRLRL